MSGGCDPTGARDMADPEDFITDLAAGAAQLHEAYLAYLNAGFTAEQAFELVRSILVTSISGNA